MRIALRYGDRCLSWLLGRHSPTDATVAACSRSVATLSIETPRASQPSRPGLAGGLQECCPLACCAGDHPFAHTTVGSAPKRSSALTPNSSLKAALCIKGALPFVSCLLMRSSLKAFDTNLTKKSLSSAFLSCARLAYVSKEALKTAMESALQQVTSMSYVSITKIASSYFLSRINPLT